MEYCCSGHWKGLEMSNRKSFDDLPKRITRRIKRLALTAAASFRTKRLIVFLTPGHELRAGGVLAISDFYRESEALKALHCSDVALCAVPGDPFLLKYTWFQNDNYILDLDLLLKCCGPLEYLQLHIPEYRVNRLVDWLNRVSPGLKKKVAELHLNVLLQNIDLIEGQNVAGLKNFGQVTCTTAHEAYSNQATRDAIDVPLHRLSICNGPERHSLTGYEEKEALLIVSHDDHPLKQKVSAQIAEALPELRIQVIKDLSFEAYLELIRRAKWSLTFGEGLDSYFVDPVFNGAVSFAVFNDRFFTRPFADLENVYPSWNALQQQIVADLKRLDEPKAYHRCWKESFVLLSDLYGVNRFRENLRLFYRGQYTFP